MVELLIGVGAWTGTVELIGVLLLLVVVIGENGGAMGLGGEVGSDSAVFMPFFTPEICTASGVFNE